MSKHKDGVIVLSTLDIIKGWFSKRKKFENKQSLLYNLVPPEPFGEKIVTIAIVLDEEVQEIIRAQSGLASLFLSNPSFEEVSQNLDPGDVPAVGWKYIDGKFFNPSKMVREGEACFGLIENACGECDICLSGGSEAITSLKENK
jgi:hypothetical protein